MTVIYVKKDIYDELIRRGFDVPELANKLLQEELNRGKKE